MMPMPHDRFAGGPLAPIIALVLALAGCGDGTGPGVPVTGAWASETNYTNGVINPVYGITLDLEEAADGSVAGAWAGHLPGGSSCSMPPGSCDVGGEVSGARTGDRVRLTLGGWGAGELRMSFDGRLRGPDALAGAVSSSWAPRWPATFRR